MVRISWGQRLGDAAGRRPGPRRRRWGVLALAAVLALASCGGEDDEPASDAPATAAPTTAAKVEKAKPAPGTGNVQGTVLFDDQAAVGIEVKLCETFARFGSGCSGAEHKATTEADGQFLIPNVPPKEYQALLVRVFDTELYQFAQSGFVSAKTYMVEADKTLFVETTHLFKEDLQVRQPASGSQVAATDVQVSWAAYPSATYYKLSIRPSEGSAPPPVSNQRVEGTSFIVPTAMPAGAYKLSIEAYNAKDRKLAEGPDGYSFTVTG